MSGTEEVATKVRAIDSDIDDTKRQTAESYECATDLLERAAAHGWEGVAMGMQAVVDELESVVADLGTANDATTETLTILVAITKQMNSGEVAEHFTHVLSKLEAVRGALHAADSSVDDARTAAEQVGSPSELMGMLQGVTDRLGDAVTSVDTAKTSAEEQQREAASWGNS